MTLPNPPRWIAGPRYRSKAFAMCANKSHVTEAVPISARLLAMVVTGHLGKRMIPAQDRSPVSGGGSETTFHHRSSVLITVVCLLSGLLVLFVFAAVFGPGFQTSSRDLVWAILLGSLLLAILVPFVWLLWRKPAVLIVSDAGIHLPFAFTRPLRWEDIHRIRLLPHSKSFYGRRDWVIVDPSPGFLAPIRLKSWRRLDLWFQKHHGVRIPLHGLDADADKVIRSIERFRPVIRENG